MLLSNQNKPLTSGSARARVSAVPDASPVKTAGKWTFVATWVVGIIAIVYLLVGFFGDDGGEAFDFGVADTAPPEYLYLDGERASAYLGQILGGLSEKETRKQAESEERTAKLVGAEIGEAARKTASQRESQETVTHTPGDRFYRLLRYLRKLQTESDLRNEWMVDLSALVGEPSDALPDPEGALAQQLAKLDEGDFVRIRNVYLFAPSYAVLDPKTQYALPLTRLLRELRPEARRVLKAPTVAAAVPVSQKQHGDVAKYRRLLGKNPRIPFVGATLDSAGRALGPDTVIFLVPAKRLSLLDEPRLLAGRLTVVGKVAYVDQRLQEDASCSEEGRLRQCAYVDRQTVSIYGKALTRASQRILNSLRIDRGAVRRTVRESVTFRVPVVVVIPVAIYQ
jgi:hypothetical protein